MVKLMMINKLIVASYVIWVLLTIYQTLQHIKGKYKMYRVSSRYINIVILLIVMLVTWFVLVCMKVDYLMGV